MAQLVVKILSDVSQFTAGMRRSSDQVENFGKSTQRAHGSLEAISTYMGGPAAAAATAVAGGLAYASTKAAEFDKTLSGVKAVTGASADDMKLLGDLALELGASTSFSATEAAEAIGELAKGGVSVADILGGAAKATLDLAAASGENAAPAAALAANAMSLFNIEGARTAEVANAVAGFANATTGDMNDFKFALSAVGATASLAGQDFDQTAVALALMGKAGKLGSDAGTSLKTMLLNLIPTTTAQKEVFADLGLATFDAGKAIDLLTHFGVDAAGMAEGELLNAIAKSVSGITDWNKATEKQKDSFDEMLVTTGVMGSKFLDAEGNFKDLRDIAGVLNTALEGLSESQQTLALKTLFGNDAIAAASILAEAGAEGFDTMTEAVTEDVTAAEVAAERTNNLAGSMDAMQGAVETAAIELGREMAPAIREVVDGLSTFLKEHVIPFIKEHGPAFGKQLSETVTFLKQVAGAIGPLIGPIGMALKAVVDSWGESLDAFIKWTFDTIVAIVNVKNAIGDFFAYLGYRVRSKLDEIGEMLSGIGTTLKTAAETIGADIVAGIVEGLKPEAIGNKIKSILGGALETARSTIEARSPSDVYAKEVGLPMALGIVAGLELGTPEVIAGVEELLGRGLNSAAALVKAWGPAVSTQVVQAIDGTIRPGLAGITGFIKAWTPELIEAIKPAMSALEQSLYGPLTTGRGSGIRGALEQSLYGALTNRGGSPWLNLLPNQALIGARQGVAESISQTELKQRFGDVGATAWKAFIDATKTGSLASGLTAGQAMQSVVDAAKAAGVPKWQELGATLMEAFTTSLVESTEISRARVAELLSLAQQAVAATQQIKSAAAPNQGYGAGTGGGGTGGSGAGTAHTPFVLPSLQIKAMADGAIARGPLLALIGEGGPEAAVPLGRLDGMVREAARSGAQQGLAAAGAGAGGPTMKVELHNPSFYGTGGPREFVRQINRIGTENTRTRVAVQGD